MAKDILPLQDEEPIPLKSSMKMWTVWIKDQTAHSVQSDLDLHCPQKLLVSSLSVRKDLTICKSVMRVSDPEEDLQENGDYEKALVTVFSILTLSQMTNFRLFQSERLCRRHFQI